jgi:transmembrane sensor
VLAVVLAAGAGAWVLTSRDSAETFVTSRGETRRLALADGSTVTLDSGSRLNVRMGRGRRDLSLEQGRAHFEVAKDPRRPFIVAAGPQRIRTIGTVFDVSHDGRRLTVLLVEGKVAVGAKGRGAAPAGERMMAPGDRLTFSAGRVTEDRPNVAKLTAWRSGQAMFDDDRLAAAADELNRYSQRPLVIADGAAADLRVSGVFRAGATEEFASSVAALLPISVTPEPTRIVIRSRPAAQ